MESGVIGFEQDIINMIYSFNAGAMSEYDLENLMAAEKKRTAYSIMLANGVREEMENIFTLYDKMVGSMDKRVVIPTDVLQAVFQYIGKGMMIIKNFQRIVKTSSLTVGSTIAAADAEFSTAAAAEKVIDVPALLAILDELQKKQKSVDDEDDDDSSSLFYKKKKDVETQTPFPLPHTQPHHKETNAGNHHIGHSVHGGKHHQGEYHGHDGGFGIEGHHTGPDHLSAKRLNLAGLQTHPQGEYHGPGSREHVHGHEHGGPTGSGVHSHGEGYSGYEELSMNQREMRFGVPGERPSHGSHGTVPVASASRKASTTIDGPDALPEFSKKFQKGILGKEDPVQTGGGLGLLGQLDAHAIAEIEDKLSRAREIQTKGIHLELKVEQMEKEEMRITALNAELQQRMQEMEDKYANIDDIIEQRYRRYMLEQQILIQMNRNKANGNKFLENMSEMDRRARERKMLMKLRAVEHEQKRLQKKAEEEAAAAELAEKKHQEMLDAGKDSDDETGSTKTKRHRAKVEKLKLKGDHLDNKVNPEEEERLKRLQRGKKHTMEITDESIEILSYLMRHRSSDAGKGPTKYIDIKAIDTDSKETSTEDLLGEWSPPPLRPFTVVPLTFEKETEKITSNIVSSLNVSPIGSRPTTAEMDSMKVNFARIYSRGNGTAGNLFASYLKQAENPLLVLFNEFGEHLPDNWRLRLLRSAAYETAKQFPKVVSQVFTSVNNELLELESKTMKGLHDLGICEKSTTQLVSLKQAGHSANAIYQNSISELYKLLGEIQARSLWIEFRLREFRILFEKLSLLETRESFAECREFENSYDSFMVCQGRAIELQNRIYSLKEACKIYDLIAVETIVASAVPSRVSSPKDNAKTSRLNTAGSITDSELGDLATENSSVFSEGFQVSLNKTTMGISLDKATRALDAENNTLKEELADAKDEIEDLKLELFQAEQVNDRTPGALLFFATLYDPSAVTAMQTLIAELKRLKGVAECKEHLDFNVLRRRILVCISNISSIDRFLGKFSNMHSSWTQSRAKVFSMRNQAGGDADTSYSCPLCNHDTRWLAPSTTMEKFVDTEKKKSRRAIQKAPEIVPEISAEQNSRMQKSSSVPVLPSMEDYRKKIVDKIKVRNW